MQVVVEDQSPLALVPGREIIDIWLGATFPVALFSVFISSPSEVTIDVNERNSASKCGLYISPIDMHPTESSALWSFIQPSSRKRVTILPVDPRLPTPGGYHLYIALRFLEDCGSTYLSICVTTREVYEAAWFSAADEAYYSGEWKGAKRHGRGTCLYFVKRPTATQMDSLRAGDGRVFVCTSPRSRQVSPLQVAPWASTSAASPIAAATGWPSHSQSSSSFPRQMRRRPSQLGRNQKQLSVTSLGLSTGRSRSISAAKHANSSWTAGVVTNPLQRELHSEASCQSAPLLSILARPSGGDGEKDAMPYGAEEMYEGEWVDGAREGTGVYKWRCGKVYEGGWQKGYRQGFGTLRDKDGTFYAGMWDNDERSGIGEARDAEGRVYRGDWKHGKWHGEGCVTYPTGEEVAATWEHGVLNSTVVTTYSDNAVYTGEWKGEARHGKGQLVGPDGAVYIGEWVNNERHGIGEERFPNHVKFTGEWVRNRLVVSRGIFTYENGDSYKGEWDDVRHMRHGFGTCKYSNGDTYTGNWVDDLRHGSGRMAYAADQSEYDGEWLRNVRSGQGVLKSALGTYRGTFKNDLMDGHGEYRYHDGCSYVGQWSNGVRGGNGEYFDAARNVTFIGCFVNGEMEGQGKAVYHIGGKTYVGGWLNGRRHGNGSLTSSNGDVFYGIWVDDQRQDGLGRCVYASGDIYEGEWANGKRCGRGVCIYADKSVFNGEWLDDRPCGLGTVELSNGDVIETRWSSGRRVDGFGRCVFADGTVYEGEWQDEKPHGQGRLLYTDGTVFSGTFKVGQYVL